MRKMLLAVLIGLALPLTTGVAYAGGWAILKLDALPIDTVAGEANTIGFTVLQHGDHPLANLDARITATNVETGQRLQFEARDQGKPGHYQAQVTFPSEGVWKWSVNAFGEHPMPPLQVLAAAVDPAPAPSVVITQPSSDTVPPASRRVVAVGLVAGGMLLLASAGLLAHGPRLLAARSLRASMSTE
jgi:hypothetical protein